MFLSSILWVCLFIPMIFIRPIYVAMGQDENVIPYATQYVHTVSPFLFLYTHSQIIMGFASNQRVTWYGGVSTPLGAITHFISVIILYKWLNWGFTGICWATSIHFLTRFLSNFTFITFDPHWK